MSDSSPAPRDTFFPASAQGSPPDQAPSHSQAGPSDQFPQRPVVRAGWRQHATTALVAGVVAAVVAGLVSWAVQFGARNLAVGSAGGDTLIEEGKLTLGVGGKHDVYYPVPFESPPNVQLDGTNVNWSAVKLAEQKADHFTIQSNATVGFPVDIHWRAEGLRKGR